MDERKVVEILVAYFSSKGFYTFAEFQITGRVIDLGNKDILRPDLLVYQDGCVIMIEAENIPYVEHALDYLPFSNYTYLAYPFGSEKNGWIKRNVAHQVDWAILEGLGVLRVHEDKIEELVRPRFKKVNNYVLIEIKKIINNRLKKLRKN